MSMKPLIVSATLFAWSAGLLPAADSQLLNLVMPDAKILADVNVDSAKTSPFGLYVVSQIQAQAAQHLQGITTLTGFDPTRDLDELLIASNAVPGQNTGLVLARGFFDAARIQAAALASGGSTLNYKGVTVILDPKQVNAVAFPSANIAVAGDIAGVEAALDRQTAPSQLSAALLDLVNRLSPVEDAWGIVNTPLSNLKPPASAPNPAVQNAFQNIQQASGGVKFGPQIVYTGQLIADTPQNATSIAGVVQLFANMAQLQAQQKNPQLATVLSSLTVSAGGTQVSLSLSVPESVAEQAFQPAAHATPQPLRRAPHRQ